MTKHELGHASYQGRNTSAYRNYLQSKGLLGKRGYDGHGSGDPSGKRALMYQNLGDLRHSVPKRIKSTGI